jgi:hypothetical protein
MTRETERDAEARNARPENAGPSTDQYVTGTEEDGDFLVDQTPVATTPAHGSSNKGINDLKANRES